MKGEKSSDMFLPQHIVVIKDTGVVFIRSAVPLNSTEFTTFCDAVIER